MSTSGTRIGTKPRQGPGKSPRLTRHWRGLFLDLLAETSNVTASARGAGISPSRAYKVV